MAGGSAEMTAGMTVLLVGRFGTSLGSVLPLLVVGSGPGLTDRRAAIPLHAWAHGVPQSGTGCGTNAGTGPWTRAAETRGVQGRCRTVRIHGPVPAFVP